MGKATYLSEDDFERLDWFVSEFKQYDDFEVNYKVDPSIIDCHGQEYRAYCISVKDKMQDIELEVLVDIHGNYVYNVYEDVYENDIGPADLWKYFYFERCSQR